MEITVKLKDGRTLTMKEPDTLEDSDKGKEISLFLFNGELYGGIFDGVVEDEDEDLIIKLKRGNHIIGLPLSKIIGWYYG